jgi:hypothetical protein
MRRRTIRGTPTLQSTIIEFRRGAEDLGQLEKAGTLLRKAHESFLNRFGKDHPSTKIARRHLIGLEIADFDGDKSEAVSAS